jgi:hypothetical protein
MKEMGFDIGQPVPSATDQYSTTRKGVDSPTKVVAPKMPDKMKQFLENDGKVLRAYCLWSEGGEKEMRKFVRWIYLTQKIRNCTSSLPTIQLN